MRIIVLLGFALLCAAVLAACGGPSTPTTESLDLALVDHFVEIPRIPNPAYHRDGAEIQAVPDGVWHRAGARAGDVIASIGGKPVWTADEAHSLLAPGARSLRVTSRVGLYGTTLLDVELVR